MKQITLGILAHVDGGKTTLSMSMLYLTGKIKNQVRVDHKDTCFDTYDMEKDRGITIFSSNGVMDYNDTRINLIDTPGHVDFSAEMERTLQVLDYCILVVSGNDKISGHTLTLWGILKKYNIPTFVFVNKMDIGNITKEEALQEIKNKLKDNFVDFTDDQKEENIAMCNEEVMEQYLENGILSKNTISNLVFNREVFPCYFGSALKNIGVEELLKGIEDYTIESIYNEEFGGRIYKISRDGNFRLTHMKITGGSIKVKDSISGITNEEKWNEKVNEIRVYTGDKYENINEGLPGMIVAITGLTKTKPGMGLGFEEKINEPVILPVLSYKVIPEENITPNKLLKDLKEIEEEDPTLSFTWNEETKEISARLMGPIQIQLLKHILKNRFDVDASFGSASILYKETMTTIAEGVGHFEPLRHYAEVHLLMKPAPLGSGITVKSSVSENDLSLNWQRLIETHIKEKEHKGVLIGSPITDIEIEIIGGKAHLKHTEGGDFRQATYRAIRQGLKKAESALLEPYYNFVLKIPNNNVGKAMTDISNFSGKVVDQNVEDEFTTLTGFAPVACIHTYMEEINEYTHGLGSMSLDFKGYSLCHNQIEVVDNMGYDSEADYANPTGSVFCANGAGFNVPWDEVENYMHVTCNTDLNKREVISEEVIKEPNNNFEIGSYASDKELEEIFERTFGPVKRRNYKETVKKEFSNKKTTYKSRPILPKCLLIDGYNIIYAWDNLKDLVEANIDGARDKLLEIISNYQGFVGCEVIVVFDAYNVERKKETIYKHNNIYVVFSKEAETADMYIAKTTHKLAKKYNVVVASSDRLEQLIVMGHGGVRMSAENFYEEVKSVNKQIESSLNKNYSLGNFVIK